ncbi:MAG: acylphosphatase [Nocardioides sp.]|nr:acylphosphatase [Nocardioides sp.]
MRRARWWPHDGTVGVAVDVSVSGRVQGVAFRAYAEQEARRLGVTGWVRNEPDGSVAGHFEGDREAVDALVDWCRRGPRTAHVSHVAAREGATTGATRFEIRY